MASHNEQISNIKKQLDTIWVDMLNDPLQALSDSQKTEHDCRKINFAQGIVDSQLYQGWCLIFLSRLKEAIEIFLKLSGLYKDNETDLNNLKILNALGVAYNDLGDNASGFHYYSRCLKLSRKVNNLERELSVLTNMGTYYVQNNNYNKALNHFQQILEKIDNSEKSQELKSVVLLSAGKCYSKIQKYQEAEKALLESLAISKKFHNRVNESESLYELAGIKLGQNNSNSALEYISTALEICRNTNNKRVECDLLLMLGGIKNDISQYKKALALSSEIKYKQVYQQCCKKLSIYYEESKDFSKSLEYIKEHYRIKEELNNLETEKKFSNLSMEYEIEKNKKNADIFKIQNIELKESLNWMTILNKIAQETISSLKLDNIFNTVYKNINVLMDASLFHIVFLDKEKNCLNIVKAFENGNEIAPFTHSSDAKKSYTAWSIKNKKEVVIKNLDKEYSNYIKERAFYGEGRHAKSHITVPIFLRNNEVGAVAIQSYHEDAYREEHVELLKSLAAYLAIAVDNSRNYEKVKELNKIILKEKKELVSANKQITTLATHDNLTGLKNRRVFNELLETAMMQSNRRNETLAILFIDLDNFKPVNDTWGHRVGDHVLIEVAKRLRSLLRSTDSVARIGGDEFLILLNPVSNRDEAGIVTEKVIKTVEQTIYIENKEINISLSVGISMFPEEGETTDQLITNADAAMYKIKKEKKQILKSFSGS